MFRKSSYEIAIYWSTLDNPFLRLKQRMLLKKYLAVVKKYNIEYQKMSIEQKNNMIIDELIIQRKAYLVHSKIRNSFDDVYVRAIDKNKFEEAKQLVDEEIERMNLLIENIKNNEDYMSDYSLEDLEKLFDDKGLIESYMELSGRLKENNEKSSKIVNFDYSKIIKDENIEKENKSLKLNNIVLFPNRKE